MIIPRQCDNCQIEYQAEEKYLKRGQGRYCSISCSTIHRYKLTPLPTPNAICALCNKEFYRQPSHLKSKSGLYFCCKEHQNEGYRKDLVVTIARKSPRSPQKLSKQQIIDAWLAGDNAITLTKGTNTDTKTFVKEYLKSIRGDKCELCGFVGINPYSGNSIIQMDHVDGNCFNNAPSNLQLLCPNCHAMTPTYGSLNKGSGRVHRRKLNK